MCRLHIAFHGCYQSTTFIGTTFANSTEYVFWSCFLDHKLCNCFHCILLWNMVILHFWRFTNCESIMYCESCALKLLILWVFIVPPYLSFVFNNLLFSSFFISFLLLVSFYLNFWCFLGHNMFILYAFESRYNNHAEINNIIILYPQTHTTVLNPNGCFDW